ncbi:unnamed protein product [Ectocarpus sp. 12 AP-2014]
MMSFLVVATLTAASGASPALGFLASGNGVVRSTNEALQLQASPGDPPSSRPTRVPPRFSRGSTRGPPSSNNNVGRSEFDGSTTTSGGLGGAWGTGGTSSPSPTSPGYHAAISDTVVDDFGGSGKVPLQERLQAAPTFLRDKAVDLREDARDRVQDIREGLATVTSSINSDYVAPLAHLARNPSTIHYTAAMSARLWYFMTQQSLISSTVGGKLSVDPVALSRAILAALAGGREEPILEAMRIIPDEKITSTESYAWWSRNLKGIVAVMKREAVSIESGEYKLPYDMRIIEAMGLLRYNPAKMLVAFSTYYRDELQRKQKASAKAEDDFPSSTFSAPGRYPEYFLANEDLLSTKRSQTMDYDMESKMWGVGDAMRRRSILRIGRALADKDPETASLLDVGCGTGRFLTFVKSNFETLKVTALDLSLFNLRMAKQNLNGVEGVTYVESNAEHMAIENESQDVVTCNFVLSTIPKEAQTNVINEIARTLKPGGKAIVVDATQPEFDGAGVCTLDRLPSWGQMTPTYRAYLKSDLEYSLIKAGLFVQDKEINWVSKVIVAQKPPRLSAPSTHGRLMGVGS